MTILRGGKRTTVPFVLRKMPNDYSQSRRPQSEGKKPSAAEKTYNDLGIEIQALTPQIAEHIGVKKDVQGVVISSVESGSPAHLAGLRSGNIIEKVGDKRVTSPEEFRDAAKDLSVKKGVLLLIRSGAGARFILVRAD